MKNSTHSFDLFTDIENFLSELSVQEESLLSGGCAGKSGKSGRSKSGKSNKSCSKLNSGCVPVVVPPPVVTGDGY
ncbi:hypothetical protein IQ226_00505 [Dolichospermum sp. LEGE 00240]|jgi:hypothetical protein|uniref:hypothetical protein n=1 Tax=Aphanizomenonaceae TaxID=1892259 RepID=UPI0018801BA6|nr:MULTISPECIES: hypothetical protein [Aphanizomenonaceae]MDM3847046.1 hypothetical protein [Aphanizomenon gracile PMC638.10]MDM3848852.1 hypothetical protein [Aphanizomenon gracile PMC627.10]MDM3854291.1 hypothetical protein [Aphanizomenon gracile PMC649.10]MDM3858420.1 hypothetical protein [Aphanizomenon gracile PMC644.10]MBE9247713.1 hypothetical protein [Dolichospermum sp. LEGE 00240]